jgi:hypothetical protein
MMTNRQIATVTFSQEELFAHALAGASRQVMCILRKAKPTEGAGNKNDWQITIEGVLGEAALSKYLNRYQTGIVQKDAIDVGDLYEVRTSKSHSYEMRLKPTDRDDLPYWFLTGVNGKYVVRGWIMGGEGKQKKWWGVRMRPDHPAFWVPQSALNCPTVLPPAPKNMPIPCGIKVMVVPEDVPTGE